MREWNRLEIGKLQTEGATLGKKKQVFDKFTEFNFSRGKEEESS